MRGVGIYVFGFFVIFSFVRVFDFLRSACLRNYPIKYLVLFVPDLVIIIYHSNNRFITL
jgi:hypothetical protein